MRQLPPLIELRAFEAAARHLSFKAAAAELGVTPTAISHQIKLLEQHCGRLLFRRHPRPLTLTPAGKQLFPVVRDGLGRFSEALSDIRGGRPEQLRITATNAFAARWLLPRLPDWRATHPRLKLDIVGTDAVLDLDAGETDVAIRYALTPPRNAHSVELARDTFHVVASPKLVGRSAGKLRPADLAKLPLIEAGWPLDDPHAPTWQRWQRAACPLSRRDFASIVSLRFHEELHAIEATIAAQGVAICSSVLIAAELASKDLVPVSPVTLSGYGFYIVFRSEHRKTAAIKKFVGWAQGVV
jgi:LysR family glycine cleavage system transcriptional activator